MRRFLLAALILPSVLDAQRGRGATQEPSTFEGQADRVFAQYNTHTPGCAVAVARNNQTIFERGYGMADLETGTPIMPGTIFESGSVAKQFTATTIMLLMKDGKLNIDDPVRKYIPELPEYPRPLLVRHLLSHTSGLREWSNLVGMAGWPRGLRVHNQEDLLAAVVAQKSLNYPVGDFYSYTNSGFALLPTIVERVSGVPFAKFSEERVFRPLGLTSTHWRDDFTTIVPGRAQAYARRGDGWRLDMPYENVHGPGGLLTNVRDWIKWNEHLDRKTLGSDVVDSLTTQAVLTSGRKIEYARGLIVTRYRGIPEISHSGSTGGYSTFLARYPGRAISIAVMCNSAGAPATQFTHSLVDALVTDFPPAPALDTVATDPAAVAKLLGIYRSTRTHAPLILGGPAVMRALRDGSYMIQNSRATFDVGTDGTPRGVKLAANDGDTTAFVFMSRTTWAPTMEQLGAFAGRYRSDEVGATWTVKVENGKLVAALKPGMRSELNPVYTDAFINGGELGTVWFSRDAKGTVTQMHSGSARVWDLVLTREK